MQTRLQETNVALREVLARLQEEKRAVGAQIEENIRQLVFPLLNVLVNADSSEISSSATLIRSYLEDICAPSLNEFSRLVAQLSPAEMEVCSLVRDGMSSKDIARVRHCSPATVSRHRERIRKKLGLAGTPVRLVTFLRSHHDGVPRP